MLPHRKTSTKDIGLAVTFTALYVVFGSLKISPLIGLPGQAITAAAIIAPIMGILLGPYISALSTFLGGVIGFSIGLFSPYSFAAGIIAAFCAGLTYKDKRVVSVLVYSCLLLFLSFYPSVGAAWLFPPSLWFQIIGLVVLASPLQSLAIRSLSSNSNSRLLYGFFITSLTSTLAGQIAGSIVFEFLPPSVYDWSTHWQTLTLLYPVERTIIAVGATMIGVSLLRVLRSANLHYFLSRKT